MLNLPITPSTMSYSCIVSWVIDIVVLNVPLKCYTIKKMRSIDIYI